MYHRNKKKEKSERVVENVDAKEANRRSRGSDIWKQKSSDTDRVTASQDGSRAGAELDSTRALEWLVPAT